MVSSILIQIDPTTIDGRNPAPVEVSSLSHYLQGFIHPRWVGFLPSTVGTSLKKTCRSPSGTPSSVAGLCQTHALSQGCMRQLQLTHACSCWLTSWPNWIAKNLRKQTVYPSKNLRSPKAFGFIPTVLVGSLRFCWVTSTFYQGSLVGGHPPFPLTTLQGTLEDTTNAS